MLDKAIDEIVYENGKVVGVRSGTEVSWPSVITGVGKKFNIWGLE
jgi:hypothetical protein